MNILKTLLAATTLTFGLFSAALAQATQEAPDVLVKRVTAEVMETVKSDKEIKAGNRHRIQSVVETKILPHLDLERGTALTMGRHWRAASPQQRQKLIEEFRALLMYTYSGAMSQIGDQKLDFMPLRDDPDDGEVVVRFQVKRSRSGDPIQVAYRLHKAQDGWKVFDVNVLGAWMSETYKASFSEEIARSGIDGLIRTLEEKNKRLAELSKNSKSS